MKQALILVQKIKRMEEAVSKSSSYYLRRDYRKAIAKKKRELKEYCKYKEIDYESFFNRSKPR